MTEYGVIQLIAKQTWSESLRYQAPASTVMQRNSECDTADLRRTRVLWRSPIWIARLWLMMIRVTMTCMQYRAGERTLLQGHGGCRVVHSMGIEEHARR